MLMKPSRTHLTLRLFSNLVRRGSRVVLLFVLALLIFSVWWFNVAQEQLTDFEPVPRTSKQMKQRLTTAAIPTAEKLPTKRIDKESICPSLQPPAKLPVEEWQPLYKDPHSPAFFFSAYFDARNGKREIRVIGVRAGGDTQLYCHLWYIKGDSFMLKVAPAHVVGIPEGAGRRFGSVWVVCNSFGGMPAPDAVSIAEKECSVPGNHLAVTIVPTKPPEKNNFALCVTPFNLAYDKVSELLEIITVNRMFGAQHAYFYNYSSSRRVRAISDAMVKEGFATVVQWQLPMKVHVWPVPPGYEEEVKYFGQMAMLQDCLMRGMGQYKFLVYTDMDELAVPRRHNSWHELFHERGYFGHPPAVVTFRNTFFKLEWSSDPQSLADKEMTASGSRVLLKTKRERTIYQAGARSKYIIDPFQVRTCGVHNVWEFEHPTGSQITLPIEDGVLHHYRNWEGLGEKEWDVDRNMLRFRDKLIQLLRKAQATYGHLTGK